MIKTITISARQVKAEKAQFIACSTKIADKYYKIKFVKECETQPKKRGLYDLTFDTKFASIQRGEKYVNKQGYEAEGQPTIWIKQVEKMRMYTEEELQEINDAKFEAVFADEEAGEYIPEPF